MSLVAEVRVVNFQRKEQECWHARHNCTGIHCFEFPRPHGVRAL